MILPTKHLPTDRALLTLGARILEHLSEPRTVSALWDGVRLGRDIRRGRAPLAYDWFVLALDLLFMIGAITYEAGSIRKVSQ